MNTNKLLFIALVSGFALALAAPAVSAEKGKGPCAEDAAKFCKDVKPGEGRVAACLKEHEKDLSQACRDRKALRAEKRGGKREGARGKDGKGNGTCMRQYGKGFASGFRNGLKMRAGLGQEKGRKHKGASACAADAKKLCGDVKPGEGRVKACLQKNAGKLSEGCKARQERAKDQEETKKKA